MRVALDSDFRRVLQILHRPVIVSSVLKVYRQFGRNLTRTQAKGHL